MQWLIVLVLAIGASPEITGPADAILEHQLPDGAIVHVASGSTVTIDPYQGCYAALGLFKAYEITGDPRYLEGGKRWTDWYIEHIDASGVPPIFQGTAARYRGVGPPDSISATAAAFLRCANTQRNLTSDWRFVMRENSRLWGSYKTMLATVDIDGLVFPSADYPFKLARDNAEIYEGLWHAQQLAHVLRDYDWNTSIWYARRKIRKSLEQLRDDSQDLYAWRKAPAPDKPAATWDSFETTGMANLVTAAVGPSGWHDAKDTVRAVYEADPNIAVATPEQLHWWVMAARRANRNDIALRALEAFPAATDDAGVSSADHGYHILALANVKRLGEGKPRRGGNPLGSTYINAPRQPVK